ncbi:hypothetical protein XnspCFBP7698_10165 [Xanthomonas sp. CFBP 7698]|nr:hypothetical protein XnspCFBP7698_10165 [Xanthomonas sp. CFBP 7698]
MRRSRAWTKAARQAAPHALATASTRCTCHRSAYDCATARNTHAHSRPLLLPRNMPQAPSATGVMPMMEYSGMNTTKLKRRVQLL